MEADDEAQGETDFDEWDWSDRGGYGDDGYGDNDYGARKRPRGVPVMRTRAIGSFGGARLVAEEQFLLAKALRSWGVVNIDSEAAFGRRAFAAGVAATLGIAEPDGLWSDIANTGCLLTLGADVATSQPLSLRWIERARDAGALWIAVDPLRSASAEMADIHVPIRPGTDIAFLGGAGQIRHGQFPLAARVRAEFHQRLLPHGPRLLLRRVKRRLLRLGSHDRHLRQDQLGLSDRRLRHVEHALRRRVLLGAR